MSKLPDDTEVLSFARKVRQVRRARSPHRRAAELEGITADGMPDRQWRDAFRAVRLEWSNWIPGYSACERPRFQRICHSAGTLSIYRRLRVVAALVNYEGCICGGITVLRTEKCNDPNRIDSTSVVQMQIDRNCTEVIIQSNAIRNHTASSLKDRMYSFQRHHGWQSRTK